jgi:hypothetical protein
MTLVKFQSMQIESTHSRVCSAVVLNTRVFRMGPTISLSAIAWKPLPAGSGWQEYAGGVVAQQADTGAGAEIDAVSLSQFPVSKRPVDCPTGRLSPPPSLPPSPAGLSVSAHF